MKSENKVIQCQKSMVIGLLFFVLSIKVSANKTVDIYPMPPNAQKSEMFGVTVDDKDANVIDYMDYHYMHMGFDESVRISITANETINTFKISPLSLEIEAQIVNNQLQFTLSQVMSDDETPRYLVVQINDLEKLVILGDRPEKNLPAINAADVFNVMSTPYSADSTGIAFAQPAIQKAIDDAFNAGGGIVHVPYGLYLIKENLSVKDNVELYLAPGAVLKAIDERSQYEQNSALPPAVIIHNANNAKITGRGEIDGSGFKLMSPPAGFTSQSEAHPRRRVLQLDYSSKVVLDGVIVKDGSGWTVELMRSKDITVQNLKVLNHKDVRYKIENDGINSVSSSNAHINQCFVITIDDAYCSKARYNDMDNCLFSNNVCYNWSGGVKAGMQSVGDMSNILFRNCDVIHCRRGVSIDTREGTKPITNVEFRDIRVEETEATISGGNFGVEFESKLAPISDIKIVRLTCLDNNKVKFFGSFDMSNIIFEDLRIKDELITDGSQVNLLKGDNITVGCRFTTSKPVEPGNTDKSSCIVNPGFESYLDGSPIDVTSTTDTRIVKGALRTTPPGWQDTGNFTGTSFGINRDACEKEGDNVCWYQATPMPAHFELYQDIVGLPAGKYTVRCRMAIDKERLTTQRLFANNRVQYYGSGSDYGVNLNKEEEYSFASWLPSISTPLYLREMKVDVVIEKEETLRIGVRTNNKKADGSTSKSSDGWFKVDHFRLELVELLEESNTDLISIQDSLFRINSCSGTIGLTIKKEFSSAHVKIINLSGHVLYNHDITGKHTNISLDRGLHVLHIVVDGVSKAVKVMVN